MPRHICVLIVLGVVTLSVAEVAAAQTAGRISAPIAQQASNAAGRVHGLVHDDAGSLVSEKRQRSK